MPSQPRFPEGRDVKRLSGGYLSHQESQRWSHEEGNVDPERKVTFPRVLAQCSLHRTALSLTHKRGMAAAWGNNTGVQGSFGVGEAEKRGAKVIAKWASQFCLGSSPPWLGDT